MSRQAIIAVLWLVTTGIVGGAGAENLADWGYRMPVTFAGYAGGETLTNFPALVVLQDGSNGVSFADFEPGATDLRFSADDGTTVLPYEIESWDVPSGTSWIWVRAPALTNGAVIYAHWGHASAAEAPDYTTDGSTWSEGYAGVWRLAGTNDVIRDSTANVNHGVAAHGAIADAAGLSDGGDEFDGFNDVGDLPDVMQGATHLRGTVTAWANPDKYPGPGGYFFSNRDQEMLGDRLYIAVTSGGQFYTQVADTGGVAVSSVPTNAWTHLALRWGDGESGTWDALQNGVLVLTNQPYNGMDTFGPHADVVPVAASLNGYLLNDGGADTGVAVHWGELDMGPGAGGWGDRYDMPNTATQGPLMYAALPDAGKECFYRYSATNAFDTGWSSEAGYLLTTNVTLSVDAPVIGEDGGAAIVTATRPAALTAAGALPYGACAIGTRGRRR